MRELVVYGLGELGQLYGAGALRAGLRVTPITRQTDAAAVLRTLPSEVPILVAVGEAALDEVLGGLGTRASSAILLQNELFPSRWQRLDATPTVFVPWLLKKRGMPLLVARPTPVCGRHAELVCELHQALEIPAVMLREERELAQALIAKYAFILTMNTLGLLRDRTLALWLQEDPVRVAALAKEAADLGAALCECEVERAPCERAVDEAMRALGTISARGRTAEARVTRALEHGSRLGLTLPELARAYAESRGA